MIEWFVLTFCFWYFFIIFPPILVHNHGLSAVFLPQIAFFLPGRKIAFFKNSNLGHDHSICLNTYIKCLSKLMTCDWSNSTVTWLLGPKRKCLSLNFSMFFAKKSSSDQILEFGIRKGSKSPASEKWKKVVHWITPQFDKVNDLWLVKFNCHMTLKTKKNVFVCKCFNVFCRKKSASDQKLEFGSRKGSNSPASEKWKKVVHWAPPQFDKVNDLWLVKFNCNATLRTKKNVFVYKFFNVFCQKKKKTVQVTRNWNLAVVKDRIVQLAESE